MQCRNSATATRTANKHLMRKYIARSHLPPPPPRTPSSPGDHTSAIPEGSATGHAEFQCNELLAERRREEVCCGQKACATHLASVFAALKRRTLRTDWFSKIPLLERTAVVFRKRPAGQRDKYSVSLFLDDPWFGNSVLLRMDRRLPNADTPSALTHHTHTHIHTHTHTHTHTAKRNTSYHNTEKECREFTMDAR
jgi:hypothetical protein